MPKRYKEVILDNKKDRCTVFMFEKSGNVVYKGSFDSVDNYMKDRPVCHGIDIFNGVKCYHLFGKDCKKFNLSRKKINDRDYYVLYFSSDVSFHDHNVIGLWRKLPNKYLDHFECVQLNFSNNPNDKFITIKQEKYDYDELSDTQKKVADDLMRKYLKFGDIWDCI